MAKRKHRRVNHTLNQANVSTSVIMVLIVTAFVLLGVIVYFTTQNKQMSHVYTNGGNTQTETVADGLDQNMQQIDKNMMSLETDQTNVDKSVSDTPVNLGE